MAQAAVETTPSLERGDILRALRLLKRGDFSVRLPLDMAGIDGEIATTFNDVVELNASMTREFARLREMIGREGRISERAQLNGASGSWSACIDSEIGRAHV